MGRWKCASNRIALSGSNSARRLVFVSAAAVGWLCAAAQAQTVPYTRALVSTFNPNESVTPDVSHSAPAAPSTTSYEQSGPWGSVGGFASADLTAGQLKARASNMPLTGYSPYMQSNAWFGDGFRAQTPSGPFSWQPDSVSRFSLDLTGNSVSASDQLGNLGVGGFILLSLYQPGTLNPSSKLVGGANNIGYFLFLLGNPNQNLTYTDDDGISHSLIPSGAYPDLSHDIHITQDFHPNGDFDWTLLLGAAGQVRGPQFYDMDFSHTLTMSYAGPAGTTTTADSGLFQNFVNLPEPATCALALLGLSALVSRRRKP